MFNLTDARTLVLSIVYAVLGMVLLYLGYRLFDKLTPTNMQDDIFKNGNVAVAILAGAFILALAIVIGAAIIG